MSETTGDPELQAMGQVLQALLPLDQAMQMRILQWVATKLEIPPYGAASLAKTASIAVERLPETGNTRREGTVSTVAIKLGADSCRTLLIAAAVHLSLYQGKETFTRAEWIACAKDSRPWKSDYSQQISTMIGRLLNGGDIFEKAKDVYSASGAFLIEQEAKLAN